MVTYRKLTEGINPRYLSIFRSVALFAWVALLPINLWSAEDITVNSNFNMKSFNVDEYVNMENPTPGEIFRTEILTNEHAANDVGGLFGILVAESQVPYHFHKKRESVLMAIYGEAIEVMEGKEFPIKAGDIIFIPAEAKHQTINRSQDDFRYLEFFTNPPTSADFYEVE
jgi:mannose-6-phosphate isomerase-like protein (cupin superfamily)